MIERVDVLRAEPHRRYDALRDEWVLVSPGRTTRPWVGAVETAAEAARVGYDPDCYLCPGNRRAAGAVNPAYESTFVFTNDFAALEPTSAPWTTSDPLLRAESVAGTCRVVCFSPRHDLSFGDLTPAQARAVIDVWAAQTTELGQLYTWVQVFENRGSQMGASNPHPHGQIWAEAALPNEAAREQAAQRRHHQRAARQLLIDYAEREADGPRMVFANDDWLVVVPFWAIWPFETLVIPRRQSMRLAELDGLRRDSLVEAMGALLARYDGLFGVPFPYSMGWHQAPFPVDDPDWTLHAHYYPPLLRSASVRKFLVGFELLAEPQRDITPEEAAEQLRNARRP
jgi:UDPglucose--hexose-1-phosphate uridylyltransferase